MKASNCWTVIPPNSLSGARVSRHSESCVNELLYLSVNLALYGTFLRGSPRGQGKGSSVPVGYAVIRGSGRLSDRGSSVSHAGPPRWRRSVLPTSEGAKSLKVLGFCLDRSAFCHCGSRSVNRLLRCGADVRRSAVCGSRSSDEVTQSGGNVPRYVGGVTRYVGSVSQHVGGVRRCVGSAPRSGGDVPRSGGAVSECVRYLT